MTQWPWARYQTSRAAGPKRHRVSGHRQSKIRQYRRVLGQLSSAANNAELGGSLALGVLLTSALPPRPVRQAQPMAALNNSSLVGAAWRYFSLT